MGGLERCSGGWSGIAPWALGPCWPPLGFLGLTCAWRTDGADIAREGTDEATSLD